MGQTLPPQPIPAYQLFHFRFPPFHLYDGSGTIQTIPQGTDSLDITGKYWPRWVPRLPLRSCWVPWIHPFCLVQLGIHEPLTVADYYWGPLKGAVPQWTFGVGKNLARNVVCWGVQKGTRVIDKVSLAVREAWLGRNPGRTAQRPSHHFLGMMRWGKFCSDLSALVTLSSGRSTLASYIPNLNLTALFLGGKKDRPLLRELS